MSYFRSDLKNKGTVTINVPFRKRMMCLNESTLNPFRHLRKEFIEDLQNVPLNRYFNNVTDKLRTSLSQYAGVPENCLIFGNGADEMLYYLFNAVRENNDSYAVSLSPSYFDYKSYSSAVGLGIKFLNLNSDYDFDLDNYLKLTNSAGCVLSILCNPNNPTGNLLDADKILKIIEESNVLILIDETYFEFSGVTYKDLISDHNNLIIIRSFSKAFSAAGLRFGYLISNPENIQGIKKVMTIFNLNLMTQAFVATMLANKSLFLDHNRKVLKYRDYLFNEMKKIPPLTVKNTATNFLLFTAGEFTGKLFTYLTDHDISLRPLGAHPLLKDYLRVTVSSVEDNDYFLSELRNFFQQ
jgi:histidinol-phosphate aminotransferase